MRRKAAGRIEAGWENQSHKVRDRSAVGRVRRQSTHRSRWRLSQRTAGLPWNLTFAEAVEQISVGDSSRSPQTSIDRQAPRSLRSILRLLSNRWPSRPCLDSIEAAQSQACETGCNTLRSTPPPWSNPCPTRRRKFATRCGLRAALPRAPSRRCNGRRRSSRQPPRRERLGGTFSQQRRDPGAGRAAALRRQGLPVERHAGTGRPGQSGDGRVLHHLFPDRVRRHLSPQDGEDRRARLQPEENHDPGARRDHRADPALSAGADPDQRACRRGDLARLRRNRLEQRGCVGGAPLPC